VDEIIDRIEALLKESERRIGLMEAALELRRMTPWHEFGSRRDLYRTALLHRDAVVACLAEVDALREAGVCGQG